MRNLNKIVRISNVERSSWQSDLYNFLRNYRATPHSTTNKSPAELLFGRKLRITLPEITPTVNDDLLRETDAHAKCKMKKYADIRARAIPCCVNIGDLVLLKKKKEGKLSLSYDPQPYTITKIKGSMITAQRKNHIITRNVTFFKRVSKECKPLDHIIDTDDDDDDYLPFSDNCANSGNDATSNRRYPARRNRRRPAYLQHYT